MSDRSSELSLSPAELKEISASGVVREFRPRTVLVSEGESSDALYIVLEGRVRAAVGDGSGREAILSEMGPGEYFGELALDTGPRSATVTTLERCRILIVPQADFARFLAVNPTFANHFIRHLINRIRSLTRNVRSLALMDAYGRVARLLLDGAITKGGVQYFPERPTQAEIAGRAGCSREMVSRIFRDLVQGRYITLEPERIVINRKPPAKW